MNDSELDDYYSASSELPRQPKLAVIDNELALEAFGTNIIVQEDRFRTGFECKVCDGEGHGDVVCKNCKGDKTIKGHDDHLIPCNHCLVVNAFGEKVPCGFLPCYTCKGVGSSIVVPQESMRRPSSGKVVSTGGEVKELKCGMRVLYSNHTGYAVNFKQNVIFRIMHEHEVLVVLHGVGDVGKRLA